MERAAVLRGKFRACGFAALAGDCLGNGFEDLPLYRTKEAPQFVLKHAQGRLSEEQVAELEYTDDTAMALSLFESLLECDGFDATNLITKFTKTFYTDRPRAYGAKVRFVFNEINERLERNKKIKDPYDPASKQFDGRGSYGNGAAMRVYPVALFYYKDMKRIVEVSTDQSKCTHTHLDGIVGAVLEAVSVHFALDQSPGAVTPQDLSSSLLQVLRETLLQIDPSNQSSYGEKLDWIEKLCKQEEPPSLEDVYYKLGTGIAARNSVPTAIYCFLHCFKYTMDIENPLLRTIGYAISLGGDTDTIATMAGAIAGAFYSDRSEDGLSFIPGTWSTLEGAKRVEDLIERVVRKVFP